MPPARTSARASEWETAWNDLKIDAVSEEHPRRPELQPDLETVTAASSMGAASTAVERKRVVDRLVLTTFGDTRNLFRINAAARPLCRSRRPFRLEYVQASAFILADGRPRESSEKIKNAAGAHARLRPGCGTSTAALPTGSRRSSMTAPLVAAPALLPSRRGLDDPR